MKRTDNWGIFIEKNRIFTENHPSCIGQKVYNEKLKTFKKKEYRSWNPYRSKLAAALLKGLKIKLSPDNHILYLGAATGTTVSHLSDIVKNGIVYAIEISPVASNELIKMSKKRENTIPILSDANHPETYSHIVQPVDYIYQDVSQKNQADIFIINSKRYLKYNGTGIFIIKARSIDVSLSPKKAYDLVCSKLENFGLKIIKIIDLEPYEKDHAAIVVTF